MKPKRIVVSGPSGFLGSRVVDRLVEYQSFRRENGVDPGELILLSSSPGNLMNRLYSYYGENKVRNLRASRVDYFTQHDPNIWTDHLGSLGLGGEESVFVNLAAVAGPIVGIPDAMMDVNYKAPVAAATACNRLDFGHWVQSSTQATNTERAGQVPYSRAKAMTDFALSNLKGINVTIAVLGLLYCKQNGKIGQLGEGLNLIDLAKLPLTPILGDGSAPLQPQEVNDAAIRIAWLAISDPNLRAMQTALHFRSKEIITRCTSPDTLRVYDAVGPETLSILEMLRKFAKYQGNKNFRPVYIGYRNMERILNVKSLGNLNRQFVSLLRSEQTNDGYKYIGDYKVWESVMTFDTKLSTIDEAFQTDSTTGDVYRKEQFPYITTLKYVLSNPRVIYPGIMLSFEIITSFLNSSKRSKTANH